MARQVSNEWSIALAISISASALSTATADCVPHWGNPIGVPGMNGTVRALAVLEETPGGAALYAAGDFTFAGGASASHIARWDGQQWSSLGGGTSDVVLSLAVANLDNGQVLYVGGSFTTVSPFIGGPLPANRIAMWDPAAGQWSLLSTGTNGVVRALAVADDGGQPALYAAGVFSFAGGVAASHIAKWDGQQWSALGSGPTVFSPCNHNPSVNCAQPQAMIFFDDGSGGGPALYVGGTFTTAGGVTVNNIARWDGQAWSGLAGGVVGGVSGVGALAVFDDGTGPALYVGGGFEQAGGVSVNGIARWDGQAWSPLGGGVNFGFVDALAVFDDGSGPALYAAGFFSQMDGMQVNGIAKWNGADAGWSALDGGVTGGLGMVMDLAVVDAANLFVGDGPGLVVGGEFTGVGGSQANRIAVWRGCAEPQCAVGDINCNGKVGVADLLILLSMWGPCADCVPGTPGDCPADLTGDCNVGVADLLVLLSNWTP